MQFTPFGETSTHWPCQWLCSVLDLQMAQLHAQVVVLCMQLREVLS